MSALEPKYLQIARRYLGLREIKGPQHNSVIVGWLRRLRAWWADDETPWCGVAMAAWMSEAGLPYPKAYYRPWRGRSTVSPAPSRLWGLSRY